MSRSLLALPCLALIAAAAALSTPIGTALPPEVVHVAGSVHYVVNRGGNIGVLAGPDGLLVVDSQFANVAGENLEAIASLGAEGVPVRFLVNTHHHGDHTGGNAVVGEGATIVAHERVRARLEGEHPAARPVVTYAEGCSLHLNGEEVRLIHLPGGHTDGDSVVWFTGAGVVHMGDLYFSGRFPYIDTGSGGSIRGVVENLGRVLDLVPEDTVFVAGHGPHTGREGVVAYLDMVIGVVDRVTKALGEGMDPDAMVAAGLLDDLASTWEPQNAFVDRERMIRIAAESLSEE